MDFHRKVQLLRISAAAPQAELIELQAQTGALKLLALGVILPTVPEGSKHPGSKHQNAYYSLNSEHGGQDPGSLLGSNQPSFHCCQVRPGLHATKS